MTVGEICLCWSKLGPNVPKLMQGSGSIRNYQEAVSVSVSVSLCVCVFDSALHFRSVNSGAFLTSDARGLRGSGLLLRGVRVTLAEFQGSVP